MKVWRGETRRSCLVCAVTGEQMDENNPPMCLPNGHVYGARTIEAAMVAEGVPEAYLAKWVDSLTDRVKIQREKAVFAWGLFSARKPGPLY